MKPSRFVFGIRVWLFLLFTNLVAFLHQWLSPDGTTIIQITFGLFPRLSHLPLPSRPAHISPPLGSLPYAWELLRIFSSPDCLWCLQLECLICPLSITQIWCLSPQLMSLKYRHYLHHREFKDLVLIPPTHSKVQFSFGQIAASDMAGSSNSSNVRTPFLDSVFFCADLTHRQALLSLGAQFSILTVRGSGFFFQVALIGLVWVIWPSVNDFGQGEGRVEYIDWSDPGHEPKSRTGSQCSQFFQME